uniref:ABC transporter transmembrane domain-containing protein n=1 Tax=Fluviicola sp. TaxID=1917219 RepID=UPI00404A8C5D
MSKQSKLDTQVFKRLMKFAWPYKRLVIISFFCTILLAVVSPYRPKLIGDIVQKYIVSEESRNVNLFFFWTMIVLGMLFLEAILQFLTTYFYNLLAQSVIRDIRKKLFAHI